MSVGSDDPTVVRSVAVTVEDVALALAARRRSGRRAVLRVTPPFSARMRARLHVAGRGGDEGANPRPIHLPPDRLVDDVPPTPDGTADPSDADRDSTAAAWRAAVRDAVVDEVVLPGIDHRVEVIALGSGQ